MKTIPFALPALLALVALSRPVLGQQVARPASDLATAVAVAQQQYNDAFRGHPQLYNGPEYLDYARRYHARTGHQFFEYSEKIPGSVYYNGHDFRGLLLAYDVVLDQLVLSQPDSPLTLRLINANVRDFTINDHHFVRLVADSVSIPTGFYEVLLDSTVQVLAKRSKRMQEHITQQHIDVEFTAKDRLFIKKAGTYYLVNNKAAVLRLFSDHSKEMQAYLKEQKLSFKRKQFEQTTVQLASYYCQLRPS